MKNLRKQIKPLKILLILSYPSGINKPMNQNEIDLTIFNQNKPMKTRVIKWDSFIRSDSVFCWKTIYIHVHVHSIFLFSEYQFIYCVPFLLVTYSFSSFFKSKHLFQLFILHCIFFISGIFSVLSPFPVYCHHHIKSVLLKCVLFQSRLQL